MSEQKWSKEPWKRDGGQIESAEGENYTVVVTSSEAGCGCCGSNSRPKEIEELDRIVACVNACAGIADPSVIPEIIKAVMTHWRHGDSIDEQFSLNDDAWVNKILGEPQESSKDNK